MDYLLTELGYKALKWTRINRFLLRSGKALEHETSRTVDYFQTKSGYDELE